MVNYLLSAYILLARFSDTTHLKKKHTPAIVMSKQRRNYLTKMENEFVCEFVKLAAFLSDNGLKFDGTRWTILAAGRKRRSRIGGKVIHQVHGFAARDLNIFLSKLQSF